MNRILLLYIIAKPNTRNLCSRDSQIERGKLIFLDLVIYTLQRCGYYVPMPLCYNQYVFYVTFLIWFRFARMINSKCISLKIFL